MILSDIALHTYVIISVRVIMGADLGLDVLHPRLGIFCKTVSRDVQLSLYIGSCNRNAASQSIPDAANAIELTTVVHGGQRICKEPKANIRAQFRDGKC